MVNVIVTLLCEGCSNWTQPRISTVTMYSLVLFHKILKFCILLKHDTLQNTIFLMEKGSY